MRKYEQLTEKDRGKYILTILAAEKIKDVIKTLENMGWEPEEDAIKLLRIAGRMITNWTKEIEP